jgi:hypothetical protein
MNHYNTIFFQNENGVPYLETNLTKLGTSAASMKLQWNYVSMLSILSGVLYSLRLRLLCYLAYSMDAIAWTLLLRSVRCIVSLQSKKLWLSDLAAKNE